MKEAYIRVSWDGDIIGVRSTPFEADPSGLHCRVLKADGFLKTFDKDGNLILTVHYGDKAKTWKFTDSITKTLMASIGG